MVINNKIKPVIIFLFIIVAVFQFKKISLRKETGYYSCLTMKSLLEREIKGIVIKKYIDYENHAIKVVDISCGGVIKTFHDFEFDINQTFDKIKVGDSLIREKNDTILFVFNSKDSVQVCTLDYGCDLNKALKME